MRRIALLTLLLCCLLPLCALAAADETAYALVRAERSPVWTAPDGAEQVAEVRQGDWVEVLREAEGWMEIVTEAGARGYLASEDAFLPQVHYGVVGVVRNPDELGLLNLRAEPDWDAEVLDVYRSGVPCLLLSLRDSWYHVRVHGTEGYFREEFIRPVYGPCSDVVATVVAPEGTVLLARQNPSRDETDGIPCANGTYVMVLSEGRSWWQVALNGQVCYLNAAFLRRGVHRDLSTAGDADSAAWFTARVINPVEGRVLNLREAPNRDSRSLGQYPTGTEVDVLRQGLEWCKVRLRDGSGITGFMASAYLDLGEAAETPCLTVTHPQESFVNLRAFPMATLGIVLAQVPHGEQVEILIPGDTWMKVRYHELTGYMLAYYLR